MQQSRRKELVRILKCERMEGRKEYSLTKECHGTECSTQITQLVLFMYLHD